MANIQWPAGVNKSVKMSGSSWAEKDAIIENETRSGKVKRRVYAEQVARQISITMHFSFLEYQRFHSWFEYTLFYGLYAFEFPEIIGDHKTMKKYRFTKDGVPKYTNISATIIEAVMTWEEVTE